MNKELLTHFKTDSMFRSELATWLNTFAELCASIAESKGFHDDEQIAKDLLTHQPHLLEWFESQILQAEFGRIMSECGEGIEATRKDLADDHLPQYKGWLVEAADTAIRVGDTCGKRSEYFGNAVVEKLLYNSNRPHKHGKNS